MKRYLLTLALMLSALPVMAWQPLVSGSTTGEVTFVLKDSDGAVVTGASVSSVVRRRGTGDATAMTTPTVTEEGNGFYSLLVDEDTTITTGLVKEGMYFRINMDAGEPVFVGALLEAAHLTLADIFGADPDDYDAAGNFAEMIMHTLKHSVKYFDTTPNGDIGRTFNTADPTSGSDPTPAE